MSIVDEAVAVIERVNPHVILIDTLFSQGMDACNLLRRPYHVLNPLLPSLVCYQNQSLGDRLFRYPMMGTGMSYPVPLSQIPMNLIHFLARIYHGVKSKQVSSINAARAARGLRGPYPSFECMLVSPERTYITPGMREVDVPFSQPSTLQLCGPISADFVPIRDSDPELAAWLDRGETVLSHGHTLRLRRAAGAARTQGAACGRRRRDTNSVEGAEPTRARRAVRRGADDGARP